VNRIEPKSVSLLGGLFLLSAALFLFEILMNRLASVILFYHFAFYVIAMALLGGAVGGLAVFLRPDGFSRESAPRRMFQFSTLLALLIPLSCGVALFARISGGIDQLLPLLGVVFLWGLLLFVPFAAGGVAVTLGITRAGLSIGRAYAANLLGAAAGCFSSIFLLGSIDGLSAVLVAAAVAAAAAALFGRGDHARNWKRTGAALSLTFLLLGSAVANVSGDTPGLGPVGLHAGKENEQSFTGWNSYSYVTVSQTRRPSTFPFPPSGANTPPGTGHGVPRRILKIDRIALSPIIARGDRLERHDYLEWSLRVFAHRLRPTGPAAVLGVGGGMEVVEAARTGHETVIGIDINRMILRLHTEVMPDFSGLTRIPGVKLVHRDARRYMTETARTFSVISMTFLDSWASIGGGPSGTFALSENGLYTVEAWNRFLDRLRPAGLFTATRWFNPNGAGETTRMLALARRVLWDRGVRRPNRHLALVQGGRAATLLVRRTPFTEKDRRRLRREASRLGFNLLMSPGTLPERPDLRFVASAPSPAALRRAARDHPLHLLPPTDDRPYFFNMLTVSSLWQGEFFPDADNVTLAANFAAIYSLLFSLATSLVLTFLVLVVPMLGRWNDLTRFPLLDLGGMFLYFGLIGLGFMFVEIGLLARLNVFLGHPTLSLAVVLGGIISAAGLGSGVSQTLDVRNRAVLVAYPAVIAGMLGVLSFGIDPLLLGLEFLGTPARIGISLGLVAAAAFPMGFAFPLGLRFARRYHRGPSGNRDITPWLWCVNGVTSVLGSGLGLALALQVGISSLLLTGALLYASLVVIFPVLIGRG